MEPANLLFIMTDQHNRRVSGCYGDELAQTPNLDALASRGTRFTNAYCNVPICVPSRASFATGRFAHTIGSWDNAKPYIGDEADSWGHRLTGSGRNATTIGKLHYRSADDPTGFPDQRLPMHVVGGIGDVHSLLRAQMPVRDSGRRAVLDAGPGESEYIRYDRSIATASVEWLENEARQFDEPWALFVSFVSPHFPLTVPQQYFDLYPLDQVQMPLQSDPADWPEHPAIAFHRRVGGYVDPVGEHATRNAIAAYYGLVTFVDEQIGKVLNALHDAGLDRETRIIYVSDHGEMLGNRGIWGKCSLYEEAVGIPMILAGADVPEGKVVETNVSLVDCFPTIVQAVGATPQPEDDDLPGSSLWELAAGEDLARNVFAEYHAIFSPSGMSMLKSERFKYVHYVGYQPQLFDMIDDPDEINDLAGDPRYAEVVEEHDRRLREILDPEEIDREARADQERRLDLAGGREKVLADGPKIPYTPAPAEFEPEDEPYS